MSSSGEGGTSLVDDATIPAPPPDDAAAPVRHTEGAPSGPGMVRAGAPVIAMLLLPPSVGWASPVGAVAAGDVRTCCRSARVSSERPGTRGASLMTPASGLGDPNNDDVDVSAGDVTRRGAGWATVNRPGCGAGTAAVAGRPADGRGVGPHGEGAGLSRSAVLVPDEGADSRMSVISTADGAGTLLTNSRADASARPATRKTARPASCARAASVARGRRRRRRRSALSSSLPTNGPSRTMRAAARAP